jgi:glycosyltransferase involved in cell wall biosynthesis
MPKVSVITPTYNHERFIGQCIESVLSQSFNDWEMLIINDGSDDNTSQIAESYVVRDSRIKLFNRENVGIFKLVETYNFALEHSKSEYLAILEGDDLWEPQKLELQISAMEKNKSIVLSWGKVSAVEEDGTSIINQISPVKKNEEKLFYNNPPGSILNILYKYNCIPAVTIIIRKDAIQKIGGFIQSHQLPLVDLPTILALSELGEFYFENTNIARWRNHTTQITKTYTTEILNNIYNLSLSHYRSLPNSIKLNLYINEKDIHNAYISKIISTHARAGRYCLLRKDYKMARIHYLKSIFTFGCPSIMWRIRALLGLVMSLLHMDVEWMAKLLGKNTYSRN